MKSFLATVAGIVLASFLVAVIISIAFSICTLGLGFLEFSTTFKMLYAYCSLILASTMLIVIFLEDEDDIKLPERIEKMLAGANERGAIIASCLLALPGLWYIYRLVLS